jgi:hypothetical protein
VLGGRGASTVSEICSPAQAEGDGVSFRYSSGVEASLRSPWMVWLPSPGRESV